MRLNVKLKGVALSTKAETETKITTKMYVLLSWDQNRKVTVEKYNSYQDKILQLVHRQPKRSIKLHWNTKKTSMSFPLGPIVTFNWKRYNPNNGGDEVAPDFYSVVVYPRKILPLYLTLVHSQYFVVLSVTGVVKWSRKGRHNTISGVLSHEDLTIKTPTKGGRKRWSRLGLFYARRR